MKGMIRKHLEILLLRLVVWVLAYRNPSRSLHISRHDNNDLHYMGERIGRIIERMEKDYEEVRP